MIINSGKSFDLVYDFLDKDDIECVPETFKYKIINDKTQTIIRQGTLVITDTTATLPLTVQDNTVTESEKRRVSVEWTINGGADGDSPVFTYNIEKVWLWLKEQDG